MMRISVGVTGLSSPSPSVQVALLSRIELTSVLTARASSGELFWFPEWLTRKYRKPEPLTGPEKRRGNAPSFEALRSRMLAEAQRQLDQPGVQGIRFSVVAGQGGAKLRGEVMLDPKTPRDG